MTDRPDVSPCCKLIGFTLLASLFVLPAPAMAQHDKDDVDENTAVATDPLRLAAEDAASCRELRDSDVRLACLDAAAQRLAEALGSMDQAGRNAGDLPIGLDAPDAPDAAVAVEPPGEAADQPPGEAAQQPPGEAEQQQPYWAAAPQPQHADIEEAEVPRRFEATIVRITRNNVGRHRFYTADGAVWEQTQLVEVRQPKDLPAVAEFRRKWTGNPTIKFDVSNRSYRVRRIE